MKRGFVAASVAFGFVAGANAQDAQVLTPSQLEARAAQFIVFVPPEYPGRLVASGASAEVDVFGEVGADGAIAVEKVASTSADPGFEEAVRAAVRFWTLRPSYGTDCVPRPARTQVRIWFEIKEGKPVISFGQARAPVTEGSPLKSTYRRNPEFPWRLLSRGGTTTVEVLMRVLPEGRVDAVEMVPGPLWKLVNREVTMAMRQWRFEPRPVADGPICASYVITFTTEAGGFEGQTGYTGARRDGAN
jgi:TonB family protein